MRQATMERIITENEIRYLLDHLAPLYTGPDLEQFISQVETGTTTAAMLFPLSGDALDESRIFTIRDVPVLFPCSEEKQWYTTEGTTVRFSHDILKSAFYLLSGYQEYVAREADQYGRYPWKSSIQHRLGITERPVVNYYFDVILEAFGKFCKLNKLEFKRNRREVPVLFLSHDVDRIRKYSIRNLVYVLLQLAGIKPSPRGFSRQLKTVREYARGFLMGKPDPYWNFDELLEMESQLGISSTWYFLENTGKDNSRYQFSDPGIAELIGKISAGGDETGIHGTIESSEDPGIFKKSLERLNGVCDQPVAGIRQHYLRYNNPVTSRIQEDSGLKYDATLGFAEHTGFRNSYAYPFRLYDFDNNRPLRIWQVPLNVMDVTMLGYMGVAVEDVPEAIRTVLEEVIRFRGVFSLLWHNCNLDEEEFPGINAVYSDLLKQIAGSGFKSLTGEQIIGEYG